MKKGQKTRKNGRFHLMISAIVLLALSNLAEARNPPTVSRIAATSNTPTCNYLMNNVWILIIAYAAVVSYRFFSGRAIDFKEMWEEFQGKK